MGSMGTKYTESNPQAKIPMEGLLWKYFTFARTVIARTDMRLSYSRRDPKPRDIHDQLAIRSIYLNQSTVVWEKLAIRTLLGEAINRHQECQSAGLNISFGDTLSVKAELPDWFVFASWDDIRSLHEMVVNITTTEFRRKGRDIIVEVSAPLKPHFPRYSIGDIQFMATGVNNKTFSVNKRRPPKENWKSIKRDDLEKILDGFGKGTELEGFCSLIAGRRNYNGITRLLARATWLTGMRSIELFTCKIIDHLTNEEVFSCLGPVYFSPTKFTSDQKVLASSVTGFDETIDGIIRSVQETGGRDLRLHILTAKTRNSSPLINNEIRVQKLDGISRDDLKSILITSCIRKLLLSDKKRRTIRVTCSNLLGKTSMRVFPDREDSITLHTLRHAFIDTARKTLPPEEVGTLSGHTSVDTMRRYGGKYVRYSKYSGNSRWFPKPEEKALDKTRKIWEAKKTLRKKNELVKTNVCAIPIPEFG